MIRLSILLLTALLLGSCGPSQQPAAAPPVPAPADTTNNAPPADTANVETLPKDSTSRWPE